MHKHETVRAGPLCLELTWRAGLLNHVKLRWSTPGDTVRALTPWAAPLTEWLRGYLAGRPEPCPEIPPKIPPKIPPEIPPEIPLDWEKMSGFSRQVLATLQTQVSAGQWISYGKLAEFCGCPGAARAVGRVMATNPWPLLVPCHRVLGSAGQLTGFGCGLDIKLFLLKTEGVRFSPSGRAIREAA